MDLWLFGVWALHAVVSERAGCMCGELELVIRKSEDTGV